MCANIIYIIHQSARIKKTEETRFPSQDSHAARILSLQDCRPQELVLLAITGVVAAVPVAASGVPTVPAGGSRGRGSAAVPAAGTVPTTITASITPSIATSVTASVTTCHGGALTAEVIKIHKRKSI
jgi:hypothetical protein